MKRLVAALACLMVIGAFIAVSKAQTTEDCLTDRSPGDRTVQCDGLRVDARIPPVCVQEHCGLILELHGDTGTGLLEDEHVKLRELGAQYNYIVVMPTGPSLGRDEGSTWSPANDQSLVDVVHQFTRVFPVDVKRIHVTGFSRGGFVTWRLLCDHADLFASAAPGAAGFNSGEATCFSNDRAPSRKIPISLLMGRTDHQVSYQSMAGIRDAAIANYGALGPQVLEADSHFTHKRWTGPGDAVIETFEHDYETVAGGPWGFALGHCVPGSTVDPYAPQYALPCKSPNGFTWGEAVMRFFRAHPMA